jgi:tyrosinase
LWNAWSRRSTSKLPAATSSYWNGTFTYASNLTMARALTRTTAGLLYDYADDTMPVKMPQQAQHGRIVRVQAQNSSIHGRPKLRTFTSSAPRTVSSTRDSLGGLVGIPLDNNSISAGITLQTAGANSLRDVLATSPAAVLSDSASSAADLQPQAQSPTPSQGSGQAKKSFQHVKLVLDGLRSASTAAQDGGYFYNIYLNLPSTGDVDSVSASHFVGTVGAFEVSVAAHHGNGKKEFDITYPLASLGLTNPNQMVVSFVRENGLVYPSGNVVSMNEMRLELSTD